jgi:chromosomal replication initiator protein
MQTTSPQPDAVDATTAPVVEDLKAKWTHIQSRLRAELGEDLFNSWFGRMDIESLSAGTLTVSVPTRFLKSWIESHYVSKLHKIAEATLGHLSLVQVRVRQQGTAVTQQVRSPVKPQRASVMAEPERLQPLALSLPSLVADKATPLDEGQTFDSFMVGSSNQLAHAAACRVADAKVGSALSFNPLFIHAAAGLGCCGPTHQVLGLQPPCAYVDGRALHVWLHPGPAAA